MRHGAVTSQAKVPVESWVRLQGWRQTDVSAVSHQFRWLWQCWPVVRALAILSCTRGQADSVTLLRSVMLFI